MSFLFFRINSSTDVAINSSSHLKRQFFFPGFLIRLARFRHTRQTPWWRKCFRTNSSLLHRGHFWTWHKWFSHRWSPTSKLVPSNILQCWHKCIFSFGISNLKIWPSDSSLFVRVLLPFHNNCDFLLLAFERRESNGLCASSQNVEARPEQGASKPNKPNLFSVWEKCGLCNGEARAPRPNP